MVLPAEFRKRIVLACHDEMGHMGMDRVLLLLQDRVYWPAMSRDVRDHIRTCGRCERFKSVQEEEEISQIEASYPLELIHIDYLQIGGKKDTRKDINILVVTDHFTRYAQAYVTTSTTALTTAKILVEKFFTQYGWPTKLISYQAPQFESKLFTALMNEAHIKKIQTTPYRPQGNAQCERFNRTLIGMLGTLPNNVKSEWQEWVSTMTHSYNCTVCRSTGFSPYFLMYEREPRIPIDLEFNLPSKKEIVDANTYAQRLRQKVEWAFKKAQENIAVDVRQRKQYHDQNVRCHLLREGDIVLVKVNKFDSDHKIADKWENNPYIVIRKRGNIPVYEVKPVGGTDKDIKVLHRKMLHPARSVQQEEELQNEDVVLAKANRLMEALFDC